MPRRPKQQAVPATPAMPLNPTPPSQAPEPDTPTTEAIQILRKLADGIDPITSTPLPNESPYQSAKVLRAIQFALDTVTRTAMKKARPERAAAGKPWTQQEDQNLIAGYHAGESPIDLAGKHLRSRGAIIMRLEAHGLAAPSRFRKSRLPLEFQAKHQRDRSKGPLGKIIQPDRLTE